MKTPAKDALTAFINRDFSRFCMPGHKGALSPFDLTETPLTGDLYEQAGFFARSEALAAEAFGVPALLYSAGGSTLCVQAMAAAFFREGDRVAVRRTVHRSVLNAFALLGVVPRFVPEPATAAAVCAALKGCAGAFITDPDYYGDLIGLKAVADECSRLGIPLLVDGAHRAHFGALGLPYGVQLGAAAECVSLHKTLPALTGAAAILISDPAAKADLRAKMLAFGSSSPSYLISLSAENAAARLAADAPKWRETAQTCKALTDEFPTASTGGDPTRLRLDMSGCDDPEKMLENHLILPEFLDAQSRALLLCSPYNTAADFARLRGLCAALPAGAPKTAEPLPEPERAASPREAFFAKKARLPIQKAVGRIAGAPLCPCPPCYAAADAGERITQEAAQFCLSCGIEAAEVL